jgi:hypothetical protein
MNGNTCYFYNRGGRYNTTVAYRRNEDGSVTYGAAFCRPSDSFVKTMGRKIAQGRLALANISIENAPSFRPDLHNEILRRIESQEFGYMPSCFER